MARFFLDTNVILRYLTQDNPQQSPRAYRIIKQLESGALEASTCEGVIVEAVYVLSSKSLYNLPRQDVRTYLKTIIGLPGLKIDNKRSYLRALDLYATTNLDFVDALIVAHMERTKTQTVLSFDQHFDRISSVERKEP